MAFGLHPRTQFIASTVGILVALFAAIIGLTLGLATPALEDGGSPTLPPPTTPSSTVGEQILMNEDIPAQPKAPANGGEGATTQNPAYPARFGQYSNAAVSTPNELCSTVGVEILRDEGGSAVDAAIASMLCVGIVSCHLTGVGGGHFMTIYDTPSGSENKEWDTIIARGMAPAAAYRDMFINDTELGRKGPLSMAIPGEIAGYALAYEKYGRTPWSRLFAPSIDMCENGYEVTSSLASALRSYEEEIRADENLREIFLNEDGTLKQTGDIIVNLKLAETLRRIVDDPMSYYKGDLARDIASDIEDYGGIIVQEDLENYSALLKEPVMVHLENGGYDILSPRPPSSGAVYEYILNILDGYHLDQDSLEDLDIRILTYHYITEAFKHAYGHRADLGDEDFVDVEELVLNMTSSDYAEYTRSRVSDDTTYNVSYYTTSFDEPKDQGTAHVSVVGPDGAAVAITGTLNFFFGSNCRGSRTGIIFNDDMDDFSTPGTTNGFGVPASPANYIEPGKRPMSSMTPSIVLKGDDAIFVSGAAGGTRITTATAQVTFNALWFDERVDVATEYDRLHHQLSPNRIDHERDFDEEILEGLREKNHETNLYGAIANVQSIYNTCPLEDMARKRRKRQKNNRTKINHLPQCVHAAGDGRSSDAVPDGY